MGSRGSSVRFWLQKQFQTSGIQTESSALKLLATYLEDESNTSDPEHILGDLLDDIETRTDDRKLTVEFVKEFLDRCQGSTQGTVEVVDAFHVPLIQYDPVRHMFYHNTKKARKVIGDVKNKFQLYEDRFLLIQQRLKRNAMFRPSKWSSLGNQHGTTQSAELTELKSLLGQARQRRFVCGFLTRHDQGQYFIEDLSARLPIDLTGCDTADGLFTENCVVVAEGELQPSGEFRAMALGLPPAESREESIDALQGHDMFGASSKRVEENTSGEDDGDRIIILSDVHLDAPENVENLNKVFEGYASMPKPPSAFVLLGNFQTFDANGPHSSLSKLKENFTSLGRLLKRYPGLIESSDFILVPGPHDIGMGNSLPRPGIPAPLVEGLKQIVPNVILASNPCRIRFRGSDLVICRADIQQKLRGLCILPPPMPPQQTQDTPAEHASFFFDQTCSTVIQESHLCPVPLEYQPITWEYDHALYVYPNPHGLILADSEPAARSIFDTCDCLNPGSLSTGTFGAWNPSTREMEMCDVHIEEDEDEDDEEEIQEEKEDHEIKPVDEVDNPQGSIQEVE
jgi:DNA polymerase epsilon subunit 2